MWKRLRARLHGSSGKSPVLSAGAGGEFTANGGKRRGKRPRPRGTRELQRSGSAMESLTLGGAWGERWESPAAGLEGAGAQWLCA